MKNNCFVKLMSIFIVAFILCHLKISGQSLIAPTASFSEQTSYPVFSPNDKIYYFCGQEGQVNAGLRALSSGPTVTFTWEKFNPVTGAFDFVISETATSSTQSGLADGCYRVGFNDSGTDYVFRAWVFNGWIQPAAAIAESNCESFKLFGSATGAVYQYYDLSTRQLIPLNSDYKYVWTLNNNPFATIQSPLVTPPPSKNTIYNLAVTDRAGCMQSTEVTYESIVPKAQFSWTTDQKMDPQFVYPEAPVAIKFHNESENADQDKYEWFLFKDKGLIDLLGTGGAKVDSIMAMIYDVNPVYTYENSGRYMVKLVAAKETPNFTCRDTFYLKNYIIVDTSLVKVTPVFTPNGDGINDMLIIKTRSLESLDFQIFNRWGRSVHHFSKNGYIPADSELAAWDGRIGNKLASPGTYFWVVDALGRDGVRRRKKGFTQMIW
jgi:gliding motility-associated-like protein